LACSGPWQRSRRGFIDDFWFSNGTKFKGTHNVPIGFCRDVEFVWLILWESGEELEDELVVQSGGLVIANVVVGSSSCGIAEPNTHGLFDEEIVGNLVPVGSVKDSTEKKEDKTMKRRAIAQNDVANSHTMRMGWWRECHRLEDGRGPDNSQKIENEQRLRVRVEAPGRWVPAQS
jgi:hypothetical protein